MHKFKWYFKLILASFICLSGCRNRLPCERHFIPNGLIGEVNIIFGVEHGAQEFDGEGCKVFRISKDGKCFSGFQYKEGTIIPDSTFRFYYTKGNQIISEIREFGEREYQKDTISNSKKIYIFYVAGGLLDSKFTFRYYIDYGENYRKHPFSF